MIARIVVFGAGYVGLTSAACLAALGHHVTCVDVDEVKIHQLGQGQVDIAEPGLEETIRQGLRSGLLSFGVEAAVEDAQFVYLCVPTPMAEAGRVDMTYVDAVVDTLRDAVSPGCVLIIKSTVPVGAAAEVTERLGRPDVAVVSNPEFLREGQAVADFLHPDRIVIGADHIETAHRVAELYSRLEAPVVYMDTASAELVKYAANGFLAVRLSFINEIADVCEELGADINLVTDGLRHDSRIGSMYLQPGPGWGGSCLPKDVAAILQSAAQLGRDLPLVRASIESNQIHAMRVVERIRVAAGGALDGNRIGVLGLAFKAGTNDLRASPALVVAHHLASAGAEVIAHDPAVAKHIPGVTDRITVAHDAYQAGKDAAAVVVLTEWPDFRALDWRRIADVMGGRIVVDTRNCLDPQLLESAGLECRGMGIARR